MPFSGAIEGVTAAAAVGVLEHSVALCCLDRELDVNMNTITFVSVLHCKPPVDATRIIKHGLAGGSSSGYQLWAWSACRPCAAHTWNPSLRDCFILSFSGYCRTPVSQCSSTGTSTKLQLLEQSQPELLCALAGIPLFTDRNDVVKGPVKPVT